MNLKLADLLNQLNKNDSCQKRENQSVHKMNSILVEYLLKEVSGGDHNDTLYFRFERSF